MIMVPGQHEKSAGLVWHHGPECSINRFGVFERDSNVINMLMNGLERVGNDGAVALFDHG